MATAARRVGRPRTRSDGPGDYVGFRAPRELKERLEAAAARNGRSLSTEAQIRLEKSFEKQELLVGALELAYGPRLAGILFLLGEMMSEVGASAAFASGESVEAMRSWLDDPFAYDQAITAVYDILTSFRPAGEPHVLRKNGKDARLEIPPAALPATRARAVLTAMKNPKWLKRVTQKSAGLPHALTLLGLLRLEPEQEEDVKRLLGPLIERIPHKVDDHA